MNSSRYHVEEPWDANPDVAPTELLNSQPSHPYLRMLLQPSSSTSLHNDHNYDDYADDVEDTAFLFVKQDLALIQLMEGEGQSNQKIVLHPLHLMDGLPQEISDDLFKHAYDDNVEELLQKEYPHFFLIVNDDESYELAIKYLDEQKTLSFGIFGAQVQWPQILCAVVASANLIVLFDFMKLNSGTTVLYLRNLLENPSVLKVVNDIEPSMKYMRIYCRCECKNIYDVSVAEMAMRSNGGQEYRHVELLDFYRRYRSFSLTFRTLMENHFAAPPLVAARFSVKNMAVEERENIIKQVMFLPLIMKLQCSAFFHDIRNITENELLKIYQYDEPTLSTKLKDVWDDEVPTNFQDNEMRNMLPPSQPGLGDTLESEDEDPGEGNFSNSEDGSVSSSDEEGYY